MSLEEADQTEMMDVLIETMSLEEADQTETMDVLIETMSLEEVDQTETMSVLTMTFHQKSINRLISILPANQKWHKNIERKKQTKQLLKPMKKMQITLMSESNLARNIK